jgi:hypothetical protein
LAAQIFYEPMYGLPSSLTVRTDAYSDRVDLRSASESQAAKALAKQTHDVRQLLPAKIDGLWEMAAGTASERSPERAGRRCGPHGRLLCKVRTMSLPQAAWARQTRWPRRSDFDMSNWWQASASNYFCRVKKEQIVQAIEEATRAPVDERLKALKKKDLAAEAEKSVTGTRWIPESLRN